jgi:hypothetical protein
MGQVPRPWPIGLAHIVALLLTCFQAVFSAPATANERDLELTEMVAFLQGAAVDWRDREAEGERQLPGSLEDGAVQYGVWLASTRPDTHNNAIEQSRSFFVDPVDVRMTYGAVVGWTDTQNRPNREVIDFLQATVAGAERLRGYDDRALGLSNAELFERAVSLASNTRFALNDGRNQARPIRSLGDFFDLVDAVVRQFATNVERNPNVSVVTRRFQVAPGRRLALFEALELEMQARTDPRNIHYEASIENTRLQGGGYDASRLWSYFATTAEQADLYRRPDARQDRTEDRLR